MRYSILGLLLGVVSHIASPLSLAQDAKTSTTDHYLADIKANGCLVIVANNLEMEPGSTPDERRYLRTRGIDTNRLRQILTTHLKQAGVQVLEPNTPAYKAAVKKAPPITIRVEPNVIINPNMGFYWLRFNLHQLILLPDSKAMAQGSIVQLPHTSGYALRDQFPAEFLDAYNEKCRQILAFLGKALAPEAGRIPLGQDFFGDKDPKFIDEFEHVRRIAREGVVIGSTLFDGTPEDGRRLQELGCHPEEFEQALRQGLSKAGYQVLSQEQAAAKMEKGEPIYILKPDLEVHFQTIRGLRTASLLVQLHLMQRVRRFQDTREDLLARLVMPRTFKSSIIVDEDSVVAREFRTTIPGELCQWAAAPLKGRGR